MVQPPSSETITSPSTAEEELPSESLDSALVPFSSDSTLEELPSESLASTDALPSAPTFTSAELPSPSLALTVTLPSLSTFTSAVAEAAEVVAAEDALADALADAVAEADADAVAVVVVEEDWEPHALRPSAPAKAIDRTAVVFFIAGAIAIVSPCGC